MNLAAIDRNSMLEVLAARYEAISKHGPLKAGPVRWSRLLQEEMREVEDEFAVLSLCIADRTIWPVCDTHKRLAVKELAQLAQLCIGIIELIQHDRITEE